MSSKNRAISNTMRVVHRYLGFFLAGIMAVYAISGVVLIFRDTDFLKQEKIITKQVKANSEASQLGQLLGLRRLKVEREDTDKIYFENGVYDKAIGTAEYTVKELPFVMKKMTHLHKAKSSEPLFFLNIFFGVSLLFFVISAFWMFVPKSPIFRKGLYFTLGGIVLTLVLLFI
jgi:uncharacterized iron-regulated membrane protein